MLFYIGIFDICTLEIFFIKKNLPFCFAFWLLLLFWFPVARVTSDFDM